MQKDRAQLHQILVDTADELRGLTFDTLVAQVAVREEQQRELTDMKVATQRTAEALVKLELELDAELECFEQDKERRQAELQALTQELKHLKRVTSLAAKYDTDMAMARAQTLKRLRDHKVTAVDKAIAVARRELDTDKLVHAQTVAFLNGAKDELDRLFDDWERKSHADVGAKTTELAELTAQRDDTRLRLTHLEERWEVDQADRRAKEEELARRAKQEATHKRFMRILNLAQCKIRFAWRVYWKRKEKDAHRRKRAVRLRRLRKIKAMMKAFPYLSRKVVEERVRQAEAEAKSKKQAVFDSKAPDGDAVAGFPIDEVA